ncbi:hypothetical protein QBC35DRAFT_505429 [Podospora australis]|uniref:Late endosomal/lysosomal adaptor and MAPK and MTOR activator-domain-containing protein n=1 Tax=Podospora australis TaxID=1536484 RepID=A0AAN6WMM7_9PEZI|nr:hypothetical protein QBC35DRAFT_505429 [Podospora australis]
MGICASCLGRRRLDDYDTPQNDEAQRLFGVSDEFQYGSFEQQQEQQQMVAQEDPAEEERDNQVINKLVERTSQHMVDIYDIVPNIEPTPGQASSPDSLYSAPVQASHAYAAQDTRYHRLLSKLSSYDDLDTVAKVDWGTQDDDPIEMQQGVVPIKLESGQALVGNFADAADAMG